MSGNHENKSHLRRVRPAQPSVKPALFVRLLAVLVFAGVTTGLTTGCGDAPAGEQGQDREQIATAIVQEYAAAAPVIGVVVDRNLRVVDVERGGAAEMAGIMRGDVLRELETTPLTDGAEAMQRFRERARTGQGLSVGLSRGGKDLQVRILPVPPTPKHGRPTPTAVPADQFYF